MKNVELTQAELQCLVSFLKKEIDYNQKDITTFKAISRNLHEACDPNEPDSIVDFEELNRYRDYIRNSRQINKKLSAIQAKLKRAR